MQSPESATRKIKLPGVIDFELVDVEIERLWDDPSTSEASRYSAEACFGVCLAPSRPSHPEPRPVGLRHGASTEVAKASEEAKIVGVGTLATSATVQSTTGLAFSGRMQDSIGRFPAYYHYIS